ncbi:hypothetical protein [Reyranella sp.]|uniref:hypothetical protein n=1 Tax=Reyranella sp. TaxID=1929291 RepID=UPI003BA9116E
MTRFQALAMTAAATVALSPIAAAQAQSYPPDGYKPLLFDASDTRHVFRLDGTPWICRGDTVCKQVKIEGVSDKDAVQATIEPLGVAGARYFLSYRQANLEKGKEVVLACSDAQCARLDQTVGDATPLGTFQVKQDDRQVTRTALLRRVEARNDRAQILWCTETECAELPLTRDSEVHLSALGTSRLDGRSAAFLRDKSGAVLSCAQPEEGISDRIVCDKTRIELPDFPARQTAAAPPPPKPAPAPSAAPSAADAERAALAARIDQAIASGDFAAADRLLSDAGRRFAGSAAWPPLQQKLAKARAAEQEAQKRQAEAKRLIDEARRVARAGDFARAEALLQQADKQAPGLAEIAQARADIATLRTARGDRDRDHDRRQLEAAIDQALAGNRLGDADRLLADYARRYGQDPDYRVRAGRLAELRGRPNDPARLAEAHGRVVAARQAMQRNDLAEADRQLDRAEQIAPGLPELVQARAELDRRLADSRRNPPPQTGNAPAPPSGPRNQ